MQSLPPFFRARIKSLPSSRRTASATAWRFVVEATAALSILVYLAFLSLASRWNQQSSAQGIFYSVLTGVCARVGTIAFFLFQKAGRYQPSLLFLRLAQRSWPSPEFCSSGSQHRGRGSLELLSQ
jgi:hypothetical protein